MRIILKQDVENLGRKGDIVNVAPGYGRNYLIPQKIALEVTPSNMKMIEIEQQALKKEVEKERASYQSLIEKLNETTLSFKRKTGEKDVIFGSVSSADLRDSLHELGFEIDKKKILLSEPIKRLGNYTVPIKVFHEDRAEVKVEVVKEGEEAPEKKEAKVAEEKPEEMAEAKKEPEEKPSEEELEIPKEEKEDIEKIEEKGEEAEEAKVAPETDKDEDAVKKEEKKEEKKDEEEVVEEKVEEVGEKEIPEEVKEEETTKREEASETKEEGVEEEVPEPEEEKRKKEKGRKKEKKKKS